MQWRQGTADGRSDYKGEIQHRDDITDEWHQLHRRMDQQPRPGQENREQNNEAPSVKAGRSAEKHPPDSQCQSAENYT
jgi:hypothetical protein